MKRAGNDLPVRTTEAPTNTTTVNGEVETVPDQAPYDPRMKSRGGKLKALTAVEMDNRVLNTLTAESEQKNGKVIVKLGAVDWQTAQLPMELTMMIVRQLSHPEDRANFSLTCRQFFASIDAAFPLRRFPGLSNDLKRTCSGQRKARFEHIQAFENHIRPDGSYDKALLTPLSPEARLTMGLAMMIWSSKHTIAADIQACKKLALTRLKTDFKAFKEGSDNNALNDALALAVKRIQSAPKGKTNKTRNFSFGVSDLNLMFEDAMLDDASRLHMLSEMLLLNPDESTFAYAKQFIDHLPLGAVAKLMMHHEIKTDVLHKRFAMLDAEAKRAGVEELVTVVNNNMVRHTTMQTSKNILIVFNIFGFALSSCESQQNEAQFEMLTKIVRMCSKLIRTSLFLSNPILHIDYITSFSVTNQIFSEGYQLREMQANKN